MVSIEVSAARAPQDALRDAADWGRVVVATLARGIVATVLGLALWAAAPAVIGWHPTTVMTGSMEPRLVPGDVVVSRPVASAELRVGQILLADDPDQPGHLRMHRFLEAGPGHSIVTKGDANPQADSTPIARSAVHGVAFLRIPFVGTPIAWLRNGEWTRVAALAIAVVALLWLSTVDGALRRAAADGPEAVGESDDDAAVVPVTGPAVLGSRRAARLSARRVRRWRRAGGVLAVVLVAGGFGVLLPAKASAAPFASTTRTTTSFAASTVTPPSSLTCTNNADGKSVTLGWSYTGTDTPASFDVLNGTAVSANVTATTRSQVLTATTSSAAGTRTISVRTNATSGWTATSGSISVVVTNNGMGTVTAKCG